MTLLKLTCPGVPDLYQGDELPFLALVDPDNRRPVDWELRRRLLAAGDAAPPKLDLIRRTLALRAARPGGVRGRLRAASRRARTCARSSAAARSSSRSPCAETSAAFRPPPGTWRDVVRTAHVAPGRKRS